MRNIFSFRFIFLSVLLVAFAGPLAQGQNKKKDIPAVHSNMGVEDGRFFIEVQGKKLFELDYDPLYTLKDMQGDPKGDAKGIRLDFRNSDFNGVLYFGFIPQGDSRFPHPVYFKTPAEIKAGKAYINIGDQLTGRYDMIGWEKSGMGTLGYRVLDAEGKVIYDGKVSFEGTGPFKVVPTLIEGPFVNLLHESGATLSFTTSGKVKAKLEINGTSLEDEKPTTQHEFAVTGLTADTDYEYTVSYEGIAPQSYSLHTAPAPGTRKPFIFSYASDSRSNNGGGERDVYGANFYIMKKIMALNQYKNVAFMQFSGDLIDGYLNSPAETDLQYANWKRAVEPFWHYFPVNVAMGNHEALVRMFGENRPLVMVDRFPYATQSAEHVFARNFVNPTNGPESEDGASYDPNPDQMDFPSYKENVFYYTYDNVGVVVMNSDYFYAPSTGALSVSGGGLHAYIMDQQLAWVGETVAMMEADANIDHVFITQHTPFFPNGGHVGDDMWYRGNNQYRTYVGRKPLPKGIIQRRDELLEIVVNKSSKVVAILTGDEHNYARTEVGPDTPIYPENYPMPRVTLTRTIQQINNGAAGAPYYAQEQTPWTEKVSGFTTQNALVFFHIDGDSVYMEVLNPDTLEKVDELKLK